MPPATPQSGRPGEGVGTGLYRPPRASVLKSGGRYGKVRPIPR